MGNEPIVKGMMNPEAKRKMRLIENEIYESNLRARRATYKQPEKVIGLTLFRILAKDLPLNEWFGLYLEEPMEDPNNQDGQCIEKTDDKVVCRFGTWIETQEFKLDEWIVMTWYSWSPTPEAKDVAK